MGTIEEADERFCIMTAQDDVSQDMALAYIQKKYGAVTAKIIKDKYEGKND